MQLENRAVIWKTAPAVIVATADAVIKPAG